MAFWPWDTVPSLVMGSLVSAYIVGVFLTAPSFTVLWRVLGALVIGPAMAWLAWASARLALAVYADGVLARGWVRTTFVDWDRIASFDIADDAFGLSDCPAVLRTRDGRQVPLAGLMRREGQDLDNDLDQLRDWLELAHANGGRLPYIAP